MDTLSWEMTLQKLFYLPSEKGKKERICSQKLGVQEGKWDVRGCLPFEKNGGIYICVTNPL